MDFEMGSKLRERIRRAVARVLRELGHPPGAVEVFFVTDAEMRALKFKTTGKKVRIVDVLAFEEPHNFPHPDRETSLGEIYVNAERFENDPDRLLFLVIHGFAHLLGFRHARERDTIKMRRAEKKLLMLAREGF